MHPIALARAQLKNYKIKPNKTELWLEEFLNDMLPGQYMRNSGEVILGGKIPDFININSYKAIIEFVGRRDFPRHSPEALEEKERIYAKYGYKTLFLTMENLKNEDVLFTDILYFTYFGLNRRVICSSSNSYSPKRGK